jgi:putative transposase
MSRVKKQLNIMESMPIHYVTGRILDKLNTQEQKVVTDFTSLVNHQHKLKKITSMLEFLQANNETIWNDRFLLWFNNIQTTKSSKTLVQDSTTKEEACRPFWDLSKKTRYEKLWLPQKTGCVVSDLNSLNTSVHYTIQNSWFSNQQIQPKNKNSLKTCYQSSKFFVADGMVKDDTKLIARKIKLKLTSDQKVEMKKWYHNYRFMYNQTVSYMNEHKEYNKITLRNTLSLSSINKDKPWLLKTPKAVRDCAVFEANKNIRTGFTQLKNKTITHFELQYKRRNKQWTIDIPKSGLRMVDKKIVSCFPRMLSNSKFKLQEEVQDIKYDCKLHHDGLYYWLIVPMAFENQESQVNKICSLDPGVRTFQTLYCPDGHGYKLGNQASTRIYRLYLYLDTLISRRTKLTGKAKKYISKHIIRLRIKIRNLLSEMHHKVSCFLAKNYSTILLPAFETKQMCSKLTRKIRTKTVRNMLGLAHYRFQELLKYKCKRYGSTLKIVNESYTTKTCGNCGCLNNVGSKDTFNCKECILVIDRDYNGSRNIMLREMRDTSLD